MKKHTLSIILISIGLILFVYTYLSNNQTEYVETSFKNEAKSFDKAFASFINNVEQNIQSVQSNFKDLEKIKDSTFVKKYFLDLIQNDPYLVSSVLINNEYKVAVKKDERSLLFAIDSTEKLDVVKWQRYENKKLISSWQESFDQSINKTSWFIELKNSKELIQWFFEINKNDDSKNEELFYAGFTYPVENSKNTILMEFSRSKVIESFHIDKNYRHVNLWIASGKDEMINLLSGDNKKDSLQLSTFEHFDRFKKIDSENFSFKYKDQVYWNSFNRLPSKTGILYYLLNISEIDLQLGNSTTKTKYIKWISLLLVVVGLILLFVKKGLLNKSKKIEIPPVKEILKEDENRFLEFKSSSRWDYRQKKTNAELEKVILKTLAAFGNTDGGILLIGVDDNKNILGLENDFNTLKKSTADFYEIHLRNLIHNAMGVKYVSNFVRMQFENCEDEKTVCKIKVLPTNEPLYLKFKNKNGQVEEKFYVRSGNSSQEINSIAEITDYINGRFNK